MLVHAVVLDTGRAQSQQGENISAGGQVAGEVVQTPQHRVHHTSSLP
jgi:hypothetical protein